MNRSYGGVSRIQVVGDSPCVWYLLSSCFRKTKSLRKIGLDNQRVMMKFLKKWVLRCKFRGVYSKK